MAEIWKNTTQNPNFQVSNKGRVRNITTNKITEPNSKGYQYVRLGKKQYLAHRLVATAFIPNPDNLPDVNHIDGNKANNNVTNLEWCTRKHNMRHAYNTGLIQHPTGQDSKQYGKTTSAATRQKQSIVRKDKKKVYQYTLTGELVREYEATTQVQQYGFNRSAISQCLNGKLKQSGGYIWSFNKQQAA
jgi:hypothetical protein